MGFSLLSKTVTLGEVDGVGYQAKKRPLGTYRFFAGDVEIQVNEIPSQIRKRMADAYLERQERDVKIYATS
ncbi:MAG TPA: hypothetical protein VJB05_00050 [archaeon]|nr:hypothetical protein [archaeon]